jgi:crotonobetainyl-CoA:carnitine CoA-transferase CaiB-like acyl-CoA transferase
MSLPLEGVRVLDFGHVVTGPFAAGLLADFGAEVVKVESATAVEGGRRLGPFRPGGARDPEGSGIYAGLNRNKRSVAINLKHPRGVEVALALARRADVLTENFSVGVMERLGLGPERLLAVHPRLIYVSLSGLGNGGPRSAWVSFNAVIQALSGAMLVTGGPGDPPIGVSNSWADFVAGAHAAVVIVAALERRDAGWGGGWIDLSQYEANALPLGTVMTAARRNGDVRRANRDPDRIPQGCYRCQGDDAWCVISVGSDEEWAALARLMDDPVLAAPRYARAEDRRRAAEEIDRRIDRWTRARPASVVEHLCREAGVPAAAVRTNVDALRELPALAPSMWTAEHPALGRLPMPPNPIHIDGLPPRADRAGPLLGADTDDVLRRIAGMTDAEIATLRAEGALQ